jgi:hypothetical protein
MEPALGDRRRSGLFESPLPTDETDPLRRRVRLVWTAATLVGVVGRALRAAAAAAEDRFGVDPLRLKAEAAAVAAFGFAVAAVRG